MMTSYEFFMGENLSEPTSSELTHDQILDNYWFRISDTWSRFIHYCAKDKTYSQYGAVWYTKERIIKNLDYSPTKPEE